MAEFFVHVCWFVVELVGQEHQTFKRKTLGVGMGEEGFCGRIFCACVLVRCGIGGTRTPKI